MVLSWGTQITKRAEQGGGPKKKGMVFRLRCICSRLVSSEKCKRPMLPQILPELTLLYDICDVNLDVVSDLKTP